MSLQLVSQLMKLSYCPQMKIVHTSTKFHGQLYVPFLNWILLVGTVLVSNMGVYASSPLSLIDPLTLFAQGNNY
jgi:K+ transporter